MSSGNKDSGPAFPADGEPGYPRDSWSGSAKSGMPLRDYFAAHAPLPHENLSMEDHCAFRFRYADAMLKARER